MKIPVAILGATGTVGQKMIAMLSDHPVFEIAEVAASERSCGRRYGDAVKWRELGHLPESVYQLGLKDLKDVKSPFALSALPSNVAKEIEVHLASNGTHVVSNASAWRMDKSIPLVIPEINPSHLALIHQQKTRGKIVTNPNCSTVFLALGLAPLLELAPIEQISATTLQAISGAGYPGISSVDILGNIVPNIPGEEEKIETETNKILGTSTQANDLAIICHVNRVPVMHGHTICTHIYFKDEVQCSQIAQSYEKWNEKHPGLYRVWQQADRPQPARDILDDDQRCHIGRIKPGATPQSVGLIFQGHNLVRGAAGAAILNLELLNTFLNA